MTDVSRRDIVSGAAAGLLVAGAETAFANCHGVEQKVF